MRATEFITELFDPKSGFEIEWDDTFGPEEMHANAYDRQGRTINISFVPIGNTVEIEFARGGSMDLTGKGDAPQVLTTVINAIKTYVTTMNSPKYIVFSAKEASRFNLYQAMVQRMASSLGYTLVPPDQYPDELTDGGMGTAHPGLFVLRNNNVTVDESMMENFADGRKPGRKGLAKRSGVDCKQSVSKLRSIAKNSSGERQRMAHWCANMKSGRKNESTVDEGWRSALAGATVAGAMTMSPGTQAKTAPTGKTAVVAKAPAKAVEPKHVPVSRADQARMTPVQKLKTAASANGIRGTELAQFLAQCAHESADFSRLEEIGTPEYFARKYDPKYAPKTARILGNTEVGDGERYKGRGFIQLTGRDNYRRAGEALKLPLEANPELAARPDVAAVIAVWFWKNRVASRVKNFANTQQATKPINPALKGLEQRKEKFKQYQMAMR